MGNLATYYTSLSSIASASCAKTYSFTNTKTYSISIGREFPFSEAPILGPEARFNTALVSQFLLEMMLREKIMCTAPLLFFNLTIKFFFKFPAEFLEKILYVAW